MSQDFKNAISWYRIVLAQKEKYRSMEQDKSSEIYLHTYGQLIYEKGGKNIQ